MTKTLRYAVKHSFPIFISFIPVGLAYGVLMESAGYNFVWTGACSLFVLAGSLQYLMVSFFAGGVSPLTCHTSRTFIAPSAVTMPHRKITAINKPVISPLCFLGGSVTPV